MEKGFVAFCKNIWEAHEKVSTDCVVGRVHARKATIVCRVNASLAGRYCGDGFMDGEGCSNSVCRFS